MAKTTIAALATPPGVGGIGTLRVSGSDAITLTGEVFRPLRGKALSTLEGYTASYGRVFDTDGDIDEAVVLLFRAPHSFTGEDVCEISCHGGPAVITRLLKALYAKGARPATAGEFTKRAFLNGKLDLTEAEGIADLISAEGEEAARAALSARDGALFHHIQSICGELLATAAHLAAWTDYPEEDVEDVEVSSLTQSLSRQRDALISLIATFGQGRLLKEGVPTAIVGRPNVGKSTVMNLLAGREKSIVTSIPGTTRDVVEDIVSVDGILLHLSDTAGIRQTDDPVEREGVSRAKARMEGASLILAVFDGSLPLHADDEAIMAFCKREQRPALAICNKTDLPQVLATEDLAPYFSKVIATSAKTGEGADVLRDAIRQELGLFRFDPRAPMLANDRQQDCVRRSLAAVESALSALASAMTLDAVDVCVEEAIGCLLELTGEKASEAVVDAVFDRFCVGK